MSPRNVSPAARIIGVVPLGVGVLVLSGVWFGFGGMDQFDMPLFAKLFVSLIASVFLFVGIGILSFRRPEGGSRSGATSEHGGGGARPRTAKGWNCPQCGAPLGEETKISPSGDVLCPFCENWFNVRG